MPAGGDDMRLSDLERQALAYAMQGIDYPVEIFGSRVDDAARGGDIDLIVFAPGLGRRRPVPPFPTDSRRVSQRLRRKDRCARA